MSDTATAIGDPQRLAAVRSVRPAGSGGQIVRQRLVDLAAELADAPIAILTLIDETRQRFLAHHGLPTELAEAGGTPIEFSVCRHAIATGRPLIVEDMTGDAEWSEHPAVTVLGVVAYAGIPVVTGSGQAVGTVCVMDRRPRDWTDETLARLALLADVASDELELEGYRRQAEFDRVWRAVPEYQRR